MTDEMKDRKYMELALELALKGCGKVDPNPLVGAVIVKDGKIIGSGYRIRETACGARSARKLQQLA